jgi:hypothetical protein
MFTNQISIRQRREQHGQASNRPGMMEEGHCDQARKEILSLHSQHGLAEMKFMVYTRIINEPHVTTKAHLRETPAGSFQNHCNSSSTRLEVNVARV